MTILLGAVEAIARDDGWATVAAAGSTAKRQAPIDPRNCGAKNFPALFAATGLFYIVTANNGQVMSRTCHVTSPRQLDIRFPKS